MFGVLIIQPALCTRVQPDFLIASLRGRSQMQAGPKGGGIRKAHPTGPGCVIFLLIEPINGSVGDPVRVTQIGRYIP
jgi:hypothetical protein